MKKPLWPYLGLLVVLTPACSPPLLRDPALKEVDRGVSEIEIKAEESLTLSSLGRIESAIASYYKDKGAIPKTLDDLVPDYLPEIPRTELGLPKYRNTARVTVYGPDVLVDGQIDGKKISDTGGWGYVVSGRQVVVFIDSTRALKFPLDPSAPRHWYQQRGAY